MTSTRTIVFTGLLALLFLAACTPFQNDTPQSHLIFLGQVSVPQPEHSSAAHVEQGPTLLFKSDPPIAYSVIDREQIAFIGSEETPYAFFNGVFGAQKSEQEALFFSSLSDYRLDKKEDNGLIFWVATNDVDARVYVMSPKMTFVLDIYIKGVDPEFIAQITAESTRLIDSE